MMPAVVLFIVVDRIISSSAATYPSSNSGSLIRFEKTFDDVYITVHRQGTAYVYDLFWSKNPGLLRPHGPFSVAMYEKYGYYEGYSEGVPGSEEFNVSAVSPRIQSNRLPTRCQGMSHWCSCSSR